MKICPYSHYVSIKFSVFISGNLPAALIKMKYTSGINRKRLMTARWTVLKMDRPLKG
jgi:hypothetical protein